VLKDPNQEVRERIELVFSTFLRLRSANKALRYFNEHELSLPGRDRFGDIIWKKPRVAAILSILKNPAYAGAFVYGRSRTVRDPMTGKVHIKRLPQDQWKIRVNDKYPAYISWETFEKIQAMLKDNYAEYDRNKTRGTPRQGAALLHGLLYCGECGHKMFVQYKGRTSYLCNALRQQHAVPVCQNIPGDPVDAVVVEAFFQAFSAVELDAYTQAMASQTMTDERTVHAYEQQIERLRYEAALAQRQFKRVDPDNRLVAAELEVQWEAALRALRHAEATYAQYQQDRPAPPALPAALQATFIEIGQKLPEIWVQDILTQPQKKALLRCLIEKVVIHRIVRDQVHTRIVWRGGETTTIDIPIPVGSLAALSTDVAEMERIILDLSRAGKLDEEIAAYLTALGHRSPMEPNFVLPSTVRGIRIKHGIFQVRSQSHPRSIPGCLTVSQVAQTLDISTHWIYDRIHNGCIQVSKDAKTGLFLFPDNPDTLELFRKLKSGDLKNLRFSMEYQDE
jgi:hypothetical protein